MNKRIYIKDWLVLKPYDRQTATDSYYLKICNDVKKAIITNEYWSVLENYIYDKEIDLLSCFLTSYFEDIISGTNIWNSFVRIHHRLYNKHVPFYDLGEYYEEEINIQDINFLIWYFLNTVQEEKFVSPINYFILELSIAVYNVFDKEWEYAPENEYLKSFYQIDEKENDFYIARKLIDTVLLNTYLFYTDTSFEYHEKAIDIFENNKHDDKLEMLLNEHRDNTIQSIHTRLLGLKGNEWVAEILGSNHLLSKEYLNISKKIEGFFLYKGQDKDNIFIEHIASGKKFNLTKKSFDHSETLEKIDTILFMGITMWKNEWWFSGVYFKQPFNADLILDEKNSLKSRMAVNFLDHQKQETKDLLKNQLSVFKDFNNGSQIAFLPAEKIDDFLKEYTEFYNKTLKLSKKEMKEANQRMRKEGFFGTKNKHEDFSKIAETGLVFFNPNAGVEIAMGVNSAFPMSSNPFYKEEESEEDVMSLLMEENLSKELVMFCIDNCKNKLSFFKKSIGKKYLKDIDFLLRFWKRSEYNKKPFITYTGQS